LVIETPAGRVFHTGDWKLDAAPVIGTPASPEQLTRMERSLAENERVRAAAKSLKLDSQLDASFPASDPPSITTPR
jgi:hypothetical protein